MIKRVIVAAAALAALSLTSAPAARADFHFPSQACSTAIGSAHVSLTQAAGTFTWGGQVTCQGATSLTLNFVKFTPVLPPGTVQTSPSSSCTFPCSETLSATGTAPAAMGVYDVQLSFKAVGPGGTYNSGRKIRWAYTGSGQPTIVCNNQGAVKCLV